MTELTDILLAHASLYPESRIQDYCKLLYQNEFGCGHIVKSLSQCIEYIHTERDSIEKPIGQPFESIGNGYCRLHLSAAQTQAYSDELIGRIFCASAARQGGTLEGFLEKIEVLKALCMQKMLPFSAQETDAFIAKWKADGMHLFSHTVDYKKAYRPSYRVIEEKYVPLIRPLMDILSHNQSNRTVIAIDGRCGAGKTTFASLLASLIDCTVIHMDDFFLPPSLRTPQRLAEPGGNIHYERFKEEVVNQIHSGKSFSYGVFDCSQMAVTHTAEVGSEKTILIEGSYALHPYFDRYADITIFCDVDPAVQKARIIARNGEKMYKNFETRWIPMEERYFETFRISEQCAHTIK